MSPNGSVSAVPNTTIASVGDNVTLTCLASGGPNNTFQWDHIGTSLNVATSTLTIVDISVAGGNDYRCTVSNAAGTERTNATVFIRPIITAPPEDVLTTNGSIVNFTCTAEGFPSPNIPWERIESDMNTTVGNGSVYTFSPAVFGDEGEYQCVAASVIVTPLDNTTTTLLATQLVVLTSKF